jgi:peroxiredoxin
MIPSSVYVKSSLICLALALLAPAISAQASKAPTLPDDVSFGKQFPAASFRNLNLQAGGAASIDLSQVLGKKPVVILYWIAGNERADKLFVELQDLVEGLGADKLAFYGAAYPQPGRDADIIAGRLKKLDIRVPVLNDEHFNLGRQLRVQSVPNITIIDAQGIFRLTNGASLSQVLEYKMTVETAIRRVVEKGLLGTYGYLDRYYPVKEMIGKKCPDFKAPLLDNGVVQSWYSMFMKDRLNVLVFWSVDCPHCRKSVPRLNDWLKEQPRKINAIGVVHVANEATKVKTEEFCTQTGFVFPMFMDQDSSIARLYQVDSTPTVLVIRPNGVIDSVMLSSIKDFGKTLEEKLSQLAKDSG